MNTYYFKINAVDAHSVVGDLEKVIYNVHWSYFAEDENKNIASIIGVQSLEAPDQSNFKPFEQLTQADIIAWIEPLLDVDSMKANLDGKIQEIVAPSKLTLYVPE